MIAQPCTVYDRARIEEVDARVVRDPESAKVLPPDDPALAPPILSVLLLLLPPPPHAAARARGRRRRSRPSPATSTGSYGSRHTSRSPLSRARAAPPPASSLRRAAETGEANENRDGDGVRAGKRRAGRRRSPSGSGSSTRRRWCRAASNGGCGRRRARKNAMRVCRVAVGYSLARLRARRPRCRRPPAGRRRVDEPPAAR